jgi:signal transduction histidine kinase
VRRALLASTSIVAVLAVPLGLVLQRTLLPSLAVSEARADARRLVPFVVDVGDPRLPGAVFGVARRVAPRQVDVVLSSDVVLGDAPRLGRSDTAVERARRGEEFVTDRGGGVVVLQPAFRTDGSVAVIRVYVPPSELRRGNWLIVLGLLAAGGILVAGGVLMVDRATRSVVRSMEGAADVAARLGSGELDARFDGVGPTEVLDVGHGLNRLAGRVAELINAERVAVADLSHRLRTPVTAVRAELGVAMSTGQSDRVVAGLDELSRVIDDVIHAAQAPARRGLGVVGDLTAVARDRARFWSTLAEDQERPFTVMIDLATHRVPIVETDLIAIVDVLLDNVFSHTTDGTPFELAVSRTDSFVVMDVTVFGPEKPRTDPDGGEPPSTGWGLQFVSRTVEPVGGSVSFESASTEVRTRVRLPRLAK